MNGNQQVGIYAIYDDITKKKQYEKKLKLFASVLENNTEGVIITDCDKDVYKRQGISTVYANEGGIIIAF